MHYYNHHIGDFKKDTWHLSHEERSIYLEMLWLYYDQEQPLENNIKNLAKKVKSTTDQVQELLDDFFDFEDGSWHHKRIDEEIISYSKKLLNASKAGKASAARRSKTNQSERAFNGGSTNQRTIEPKNQRTNKIHSGFDTWWSTLLPLRRNNKNKCLEKWINQNLEESSDEIISWTKKMKMTKEWMEGYNPSPEVIINNQRWEDGVTGTIRDEEIIL